MLMKTARLCAVLFLGSIAAWPQAPAPAFNTSGVTTAAGASGQGVAPGSLVSIFGSNLASSLSSAGTVPLSTTLSGVSVMFNNTPAAVQSVSGGQITVQVPWEMTPGASQVVVTRDDGVASGPVGIQIAASAPAIYCIGEQAMAMNSDGSLAAPAGAIPGDRKSVV